jgi:ATP-dependent DNA helicase RecQ
VEEVPGALVTAQKIVSCVARVKESFGIGHVVSVLRGEESDNVRRRGHDKLTTFGLLKGESKADLRDWVYQLLGQKVLMQVGAEYPLLHLNEASWEVMRGQRPVRLVRLVRRKKGEGPEKSAAAEVSWEGVDAPLFEALRELRRQIALERGQKPYMVFDDKVLRELARVRPSTPERMRYISGIGDVKLREFGPRFLPLIADRCRERELAMDVTVRPVAVAPPRARPVDKLPARGQAAFELFRKDATITDVMRRLNYARSTVVEYLAEYIRVERPASIAPWVPQGVLLDVTAAVRQVGSDRLKAIFLALGEKVPYDDIRLVLAHLQSQAPHQ